MSATLIPDVAVETSRAPRPADSTFVAAGRHALRYRPLLLAVDDSAASRAATRVAAALAVERLARPVVLRAVRPATMALPFEAATTIAGYPLLDDAMCLTEARAVRRDVRAALGDASALALHWPVNVICGAPHHVIADRARQIGAAITVLGLRPHRGLLDRLHDATVLGASREMTAPLLAVTADAIGLPWRIVVGVDFGRAGLRAARWALPLLARGGTLVLAYAAPAASTPDSEFGEGARVIRAQGIAAAFARLRLEVGAPRDVRVESVLLDGSPAAGLLALAERAAADCIAVGSRRHGTLERWLLGSVTADLVHAGTRSLLIVPPRRP